MGFPALDYAIKPERMARTIVSGAADGLDLGTAVRGKKSLQYRMKLPKTGTAVIGFSLQPKGIDLTDSQVEEYFAEINASDEVRKNWKARPAGTQWKEVYTKHAKTLVRIGDSKEDSGWARPLGLALELLPESDPSRFKADTKASFRLLLSGEPLAGIPVGLMMEGDPKRRFATTDATGRISVRFPRAGRALLYCVHLRPGPSGTPWRSDFTTLTLPVK